MKFILKFLSNWFIRCICIYYCSQWSCTPRIIDWSSKTITSKFVFFFIIYKLSHTKNKSQEIKIKKYRLCLFMIAIMSGWNCSLSRYWICFSFFTLWIRTWDLLQMGDLHEVRHGRKEYRILFIHWKNK